MRVIGTAGHVDHGKSTLVQALTGIHPDRLKEEQEREMTIDLGFAWTTLPDGEEVGIIDVPGHRDFIENMLAGVGGIDAALFVIAADEGVMPQTREHLAILDLLQIQTGIIALTKVDLVREQDWLELVEDEIRSVIAGTILEHAPLVRVSARTGSGLSQLVNELQQLLSERPPRLDLGRPRLPVDRVFTISGFGTVVTGTLSDGILKVGDDLEILPGGVRGRVRSLQSHKQKTETAVPGSRTAVNISGVTVEQIKRGDVVTQPGKYTPTRRVDVQFRLLPDVSQPVEHNLQVKFFVGAAEVIARLRLLGQDTIQPGEEGWLQLELNDPVVVVRGDRYILRRPSPAETLGGGIIVDSHPKSRHKRFDQDLIARLEALSEGAPEDLLCQALATSGVASVRELISITHLETTTATAALNELLESDRICLLEPVVEPAALGQDSLIISKAYLETLTEAALQVVQGYHRNQPLRLGMPREELKSRLRISARVFTLLLRIWLERGELMERGPLVLFPGHTVRFSETQQRLVGRLMQQFEASPFSPPSVKECIQQVGEEIYSALLDLDRLVQIAPDVVFASRDYKGMRSRVEEYLQAHETITVAQARDMFATSRKYVLALLEHLDSSGLTARDGDVRRLRSRS